MIFSPMLLGAGARIAALAKNTSIPGMIGDAIGGVADKIGDAFGGVADKIGGAFDKVRAVPGMIGDAIRSTVGNVRDVLGSVHSPSDATDLNGVIHDQTGGILKDFTNLFETSETAAVNQAQRNESAAVEAWKRSEQSADRATARIRELRQTAYQDAVASLKAAGLNPVLAASNGISGSSVTAPMASTSSSQSGMADGLKAADVLALISNYVGSVRSMVTSLIPLL